MIENMKTYHVINPLTNMSEKQRQVCTPGGACPEGAKVVKKSRAPNNYFKTLRRVDRLLNVQRHYTACPNSAQC
ncbi:hypothetical protein V7S43_010581 [Phytophthora oleae]|uniref:Uncharacterized protein n=1 Tax=Phytophthora oleae TaxID=2107226 RepID=A0ABD3FFF9_9STRA